MKIDKFHALNLCQLILQLKLLHVTYAFKAEKKHSLKTICNI